MSKLPKKTGFSTRCVHGIGKERKDFETMCTPLYLSSNYKLPTDGRQIQWDDPLPGIYSRHSNENEVELEKRLAAIEGAQACAVYASGAAALSAVFFSQLHAGDHVVVSTVCYTAVRRIFTEVMPVRYNINVSFVDTTNLEAVKAAIQPGTRLIHVETPGNPSMLVSDIEAIGKIAKEHGIVMSVDNTFASPFCQRPLELGADFSIMSLTKYCNGHGDVLGGCVMGSEERITQLKKEATMIYGGIMSPFTSWMIERGLKTLPLRMRQHCANGMAVAEFLEKQEDVDFVYYPGLKSHPNHELAKKQMINGYSGMLMFKIKGDAARCFKFMTALQMIEYAVSLGETETIITYTRAGAPEMSFYPEFMQEGFFRLSVGIEDIEDILADLVQAFEIIKEDRS